MIVLAGVVALHAGALVLLLAEMRTRLLRGEAEPTPLSVWLLEPRKQPPAVPPAPRFRRVAPAPLAPTPRPPSEPPPTAPPAPNAIDWTAEAASEASRETQADLDRRRQAHALSPQTSPMFAERAKGREFPWDYASTHRVQPVGGLTTIVNINDQCGIVFFLIIPFAGGCTLEKPEARGDLFNHMHDPQPAPQP